MKIRIVPALEDNYMYLLIDEKSKTCAAVDPVEPKKIQEAVKEENVELTSVLTTHHHWDHAGGNDKLIELMGKKTVYGGDDRIGALTNKVQHGDKFQIGELDIECLFTPCHTSGHICYFVNNKEKTQPAVFTETKQRSNHETTIPSTIEEELLYNPFMRVGVESLQKKVGGSDEIDTMGKLREAKNSFKPPQHKI
ncbi:hypothetical protein LOTGIDRAFT_173766 [Lottia gigantea]|uniref:hydroxyacylglutathione hydrolase n=1 Tax=Lottia gigantea TaxID=225164 RepID=V4AVX4_LOTGI|nr:hypothetical protein LOTGIDRAFT_173766 [Lottia gigantea]ESO99220.1 hypothetical protein LOTGIDRAFT_173766 [Lottia gigantea]